MSWWRRVWRRARLEEQLDKELRFHVDQHAADLMGRGQNAAEAQRQARIALGGPEQVKEMCRDVRGTRWLDDLRQDWRYTLRSLRLRTGFAAVALLTLALGIGATTVVFTILYSVLFRPLPFPEPDRLVTVHAHSETWNTAIYGQQNLAYLDFLDCQRTSRSLELAGEVYNGGTLSEPGDPEYVVEFQASSNLFSVLRVPLFRGRAFLPEEDRPGGAPVAIIGHRLWQRRFAGSDKVLGSPIVLDGKRFTVVGVAAQRVRANGDEADVYTPAGQNTAAYMQNRGPHPVTVMARLRPGMSLRQAQTELAVIGRRLARQYPATNRGRGFDVQPLRPDVGDTRATLWLLLGAVTLVLLIVCVNIASLLLARAVSRERELAMRAALGAARSRLIRQALTESTVLALFGGVLGALLAAIGIRPFVAFWPGGLPRAEEVQFDGRVLFFAVAVSLLTGILFGLVPALRVPSRSLEQTLRAGSRTLAGSSRRLHSALVASQIALAIVLLAAAGMLGRTIVRASSLDPGLDIHNLLITRMALSPATLEHPAQIRAAWQDVMDHADRVAGVQSVAMVDTVPMHEGNNPLGYWTTPAIPPIQEQPIALATTVTPDYLKTMKIPLRRGRFLDDHDRKGQELIVVIDEVMAQHAFPGQDAVGKHLWVPDMSAGPVRVVGVVGHVRYWGLAGDDQAQVRAQLYYPFAQVPDHLLRRWSDFMSLAIRTNVAPSSIVPELRRAVRGDANDQVLYEVQTMEQLASDSLARQRFLLLVIGIFAGVALLLACIGIYGVLAYLVNQRVPEIGVRMALGATASNVVRLVLGQSFEIILWGVVTGIFAAAAAGRVLERLIEGMQPVEASSLAMTVPLLVLAASLASYLPARRASRVNPVWALRQD